MLARRRLLSLLGMAPVAGPAMARQAMEAMTAELAGVSVAGSGSDVMLPSGARETPVSGSGAIFDQRKALRAVLQTPKLRAEYESMMYERRRHVGRLDFDIANKRSFSLAAKITFQRQRNVEREIAEDAAEVSYWDMTQQFLMKAVGWPG